MFEFSNPLSFLFCLCKTVKFVKKIESCARGCKGLARALALVAVPKAPLAYVCPRQTDGWMTPPFSSSLSC